jgi:hypothetical protein
VAQPSASGFNPSICRLIGYNPGMNMTPDNLPDDPLLLKQMLLQMFGERQVDKGQIVDLKEQVKLLRDRFSVASPSKQVTRRRHN